MSIRQIATFAAVLCAFTTPAAFAATHWQNHHPRRVEVNERLANQNRRIHAERREGEFTKSQARALHTEDRQVRHEERVMASHDNGHLTRADQRALNQQENAISHQIGR